eukprot:768553-Hanusia_phi.AAC.4
MADGLVAVHCDNGLGRTGTMLAAYLIAFRGFTAREAIGWMRLARPGSVIGVQQEVAPSVVLHPLPLTTTQFLVEREYALQRAGFVMKSRYCTQTFAVFPAHSPLRSSKLIVDSGVDGSMKPPSHLSRSSLVPPTHSPSSR